MFCNTPLRSLRDDATCVRMFSSGSHKTLTGPTFAQICFLTEATDRFVFCFACLFCYSAGTEKIQMPIFSTVQYYSFKSDFQSLQKCLLSVTRLFQSRGDVFSTHFKGVKA